MRCPASCDAIIANQVETLNTLTNLIKSNRETGSVPPITLCKATVPLFLGLARAMGRFSQSEPPLLCLLFPRPKKFLDKVQIPLGAHTPNGTLATTSLIYSDRRTFRSIISRSMSTSLLLDTKVSAKDPLHKQLGLRKHVSPFESAAYFSFNQFPSTRHVSGQTPIYEKIQFPIQHLQTIFAISKKILTKDILEYLDEQAGDIYSLHGAKASYGYKTFSETINLVMVTLMRELLQNESDLPAPFTKDVQEFVKRIYLNGQTELQQTKQAGDNDARELPVVNKYKINVLANAASVDLLVWAVGDEGGECQGGIVLHLRLIEYLCFQRPTSCARVCVRS